MLKNLRAYVMKFDHDGNYLSSIRGSSSERPYVKIEAIWDP